MCVKIEKQSSDEHNSTRSKSGFRTSFVKKDTSEVVWMGSKFANQSLLVPHEPIVDGFQASLHLWCMSPSVNLKYEQFWAFTDAFSNCRSVVLTSGTLCPTETFKTELGLRFSVHMEGGQIIPKENIFASVVRSVRFLLKLMKFPCIRNILQGPNGLGLRATYQNTCATGGGVFMAELARLVVSVCSVVPHGVLCFLPNYRLLEQLFENLREPYLWNELDPIKEVVCEPRRSSELNKVFEIYEEANAKPKQWGGRRTGALMLAVFRGKVSEGIDFADHRARCVVSVGIPFPNLKDEQVAEKKRYNNAVSRLDKTLLNGDQWYSIQAYRALNQALGRCLRHRHDWGALVLVDERFFNDVLGRQNTQISSWIRQQLRFFNDFREFEFGLEEFMKNKLPTTEIKSA